MSTIYSRVGRSRQSRDDRMLQIVVALSWTAEHDGDKWSSTVEIARMIGLSPSAYVRGMCTELAGRGYITGGWLNHTGCIPYKRVYRFPSRLSSSYLDVADIPF